MMRRLISHKEIRYYFFVAPCRLFTENSTQAFLLFVTKIQRPKNFKMEKKMIN